MPGDPHCDWLSELPLSLGAPDLRMGLHALDVSKWLPVDALTPSELELRRELLAEHGEAVARMTPGYEKGIEELLSLVEIHLGDQLDRTLGTPIEQLAVSVPDDILVMARDEVHWRLVGGALLFPNQWTLTEKMGKTLAHIHGPVDGYDELLDKRMDQFFDRLSAARPVWRRNWFFHDDPSFYLPSRTNQRRITDVAEVERLYVRSEWQTLRRLAFSDLIIFTVKTQLAPISELKARPHVAEQMSRFLEAASDRSLENKDALGRSDAILDYLMR